MKKRVDSILETIDAGLDGNVIFLGAETIRKLEDEVWAELSTWHEPEEATERFMAWRQHHKVIDMIGPIAVAGPEPPEAA